MGFHQGLQSPGHLTSMSSSEMNGSCAAHELMQQGLLLRDGSCEAGDGQDEQPHLAEQHREVLFRIRQMLNLAI